MKQTVIAIVGGGAAGFFAAINTKIKNRAARVILIEGTRRVLTKVKISGGGRCNVTHNCFDPKLLINAYPRGAKELHGAFYKFQPKDTVSWFEKRGISLKAEKDGRMFPVSNKSTAIINCLTEEIKKHGVELELGKKITKIKKNKPGFDISFLTGEPLKVNKLVLATGSSPSGYKFCEDLGHSIVEPVPSLFTFNIKNPLLEDLMGQSFESVNLELSFDKAFGLKKYKQEGPLLITHWGLSGPAVLKLSAFAARDLHRANYKAKLTANFVHPMKKSEVPSFLADYKSKNSDRTATKNFPFSFSKRFWTKLLKVLNFKENITWQELSKKEILSLANSLTQYEFAVSGKGVFKEEFVTAGGVALNEVDFKTMESKLCPSLYFCGEILNIDGITGGFNFQNAWTTAWLVSHGITL